MNFKVALLLVILKFIVDNSVREATVKRFRQPTELDECLRRSCGFHDVLGFWELARVRLRTAIVNQGQTQRV